MADKANTDYFGLESGSLDRTSKGVFSELASSEGFDAAPDLHLTPITGKNIMLSFVRMGPHALAPEHAHAEEQMGTIIEGAYEMEIQGERKMCRKGDVYYIPPNVPHAARTYDEGVLALDVFNPPREGFKALIAAARKEGRRDA